eukprot:CAMPEP_0198722944 /NCGR_PEP_ID=MMETSP1475-20131203/528_1 /TAXON_ID= ORGANISM="Unidentified sp., Strain CCMP1999" /NCGR_SAMPLE_ID=MMETSP1475 /ASSEMBLY_ACC=CAM_ASM_001111 /LENGTH=329 /DNA_ID=CAMNT_0044483905 /DNA_START=129 /DNA_END=1118 /DNA_ORIENTATION=-
MACEGGFDEGKVEWMENFDQYNFEDSWLTDDIPDLDHDLFFPGGKEENVILDNDQFSEGKLSDSNLSDAVSFTDKEHTDKKRKLAPEESTDKDKYIAELERRLDILAKENKDLRKQLALVKQAHRHLSSKVPPVVYQQQPFLLTFAHNIQDAFTVSHTPKPRASTGLTLCVFFLLGAFFLPGLFNGDFDNRDLAMISGSSSVGSNLALPPAVDGTGGHGVPNSLNTLRYYGRNLLALPMSDAEKQERDAVFMCPKVVSILKEDRTGLQYVSVVLPSASLSKTDPNNTFTELVCEVRRVNTVHDLSALADLHEPVKAMPKAQLVEVRAAD